MTEPAETRSGGSLARLDELAAVTREYAALGRDAIGLAGLVVPGWLVAAEALRQASPLHGAMAYAAGAPIVALALALSRRVVHPLGVVTPTPEWPFTMEQRWPLAFWSSQCALVLVQLVMELHRTGGDALRAPVLLFFVTAGLVATPAVALTDARTPQRSSLLTLAIMLALMRHIADDGNQAAHAAFGIVVALACVTAVGALGLTWQERRALRRLEARLAFLREHGR